MFVGSMNLDSRSIRLNTEIGILVECPEPTGMFTGVALQDLAQNAYRVTLEDDRLV